MVEPTLVKSLTDAGIGIVAILALALSLRAVLKSRSMRQHSEADMELVRSLVRSEVDHVTNNLVSLLVLLVPSMQRADWKYVEDRLADWREDHPSRGFADRK